MNNDLKIDYGKINKLLEIDKCEIDSYEELVKNILYLVNLKFANNTKPIKINEIKVLKRRFDEDMVKKIVLDFYENLDGEMYKNAKDILTGQSNLVKISMYDENQELKDEDKDYPTYLNESMFCHRTKKIYLQNKEDKLVSRDTAKIYIPLKHDLYDIYKLAHEIAHSFDYSSQNNIHSFSREILGEVGPFFIEDLLDDYLLRNNYITESECLNRRKDLHLEIKKDAMNNLTRMELVKYREKNGDIEEKDLNKYLQLKNIDKDSDFFRKGYNNFLNRKNKISYYTRYVTAALISSHLYMKYKENPAFTIGQLKNYFKEVKENNLFNALECIDTNILFTIPLIDSRNKYIDDIEKRENKLYEKYNRER